MEESLELQSGKIVKFDSWLTYNGIAVYVKTKLTRQEKLEFSRKIRSERDVVSITGAIPLYELKKYENKKI